MGYGLRSALGLVAVDLTFAEGAAADSLKAITKAAVTLQNVIQYVNIIESNYVDTSQQIRDFLIANDFCVYLEDEMTEETVLQGVSGGDSREWLLAGLIVASVILVASYLRLSRRLTKGLVEGESSKHQH